MENSKIANNDSEEYENLRMENYLLKKSQRRIEGQEYDTERTFKKRE